MFFSENFMLGAGAVIIQPSSGKVVIIQDGDSWFLPKGRKDLGESIEQAALREAYEEVRPFPTSPDRVLIYDHQSGYRCEFLPLYHWTNAPVESHLVYRQKHTEPLHVTITSYAGRRNRPPGEYLTFWYACQIGPDAVS
jgi:8-oxo-dGTP pyrophosphatase MutT (NUDIX family)